MAYFATIGKPDTTGFANRIRREVVVQHEWVATLTFQCIDDLGISGRTQSNRANRLGFTTGEQGGTVYFSQDVHFTGNGTYSAGVTTVDTGFTGQNALAYQILLNALEDIFHVVS